MDGDQVKDPADVHASEEKSAAGLADRMRERFRARVSGEMEHADVEIGGDKVRIYFKPLTGAQQRTINKNAQKSIIEGILSHVSMRALDAEGNRIFAGVGMPSLLNDFDYDELSKIYVAMTGINFDMEDILGN